MHQFDHLPGVHVSTMAQPQESVSAPVCECNCLTPVTRFGLNTSTDTSRLAHTVVRMKGASVKRNHTLRNACVLRHLQNLHIQHKLKNPNVL